MNCTLRTTTLAAKLSALALLLLLCSGAVSAKTVLLYHTSDMHGSYLAQKEPGSNGEKTGGLAAYAAQAKKEKLPVLFVDSGDWFQGTPEGNLQHGLQAILLFNQLGMAASTPGNHDYDFGEESLRALISSAAFPVVNCNIFDRNTGKRPAYLKPWAIMNFHGVRIGVTGALDHTVSSGLAAHLAHLEVREEAGYVAQAVREMEKKGAQFFVVLTHMGIYRDCADMNPYDCQTGELIRSSGTLAIARRLKGKPALILGGHKHMLLKNGFLDGESGVWLSESGSGMKHFTRAELNFDDATGKFRALRLETRDVLPARDGQDPKMLAAVTAVQKMAGDMDEVIGASPAILTKNYSVTDSSVVDWITDVYRKRFKTELAFMQGSGVRNDLPAGKLTARDVYNTLPYDNDIYLVRISGRDILLALQDNHSYRGKYHLRFSGMTAVYKVDPAGRLLGIDAFVDGKPLDPERHYTAAINGYLMSGAAFGRAFLNASEKQDLRLNVRQPLLDEIKETGTIIPPTAVRNSEIKI